MLTLGNVPALAIAIMCLVLCMLLYRRWKNTRDGMVIASGIIPRLLIGIVYFSFALGEIGVIGVTPIELRGSLVRSLIALLLLSELMNHVVLWRKGR
jgi:hypothetical protein